MQLTLFEPSEHPLITKLRAHGKTVVVITPHIIADRRRAISDANARHIERQGRELALKKEWVLSNIPSARSPFPAFGGGREPTPPGESAGDLEMVVVNPHADVPASFVAVAVLRC